MTNCYECPECKEDLKKTEIPEWARKYFDYRTHTTKAIEIYDNNMEKIIEFECPFCSHKWKPNDEVKEQGE